MKDLTGDRGHSCLSTRMAVIVIVSVCVGILVGLSMNVGMGLFAGISTASALHTLMEA